MIVFDLDDTLYSELDFVKSGFKAVDSFLKDSFSFEAFDILWNIFQKNGSGAVFNVLYDNYGEERFIGYKNEEFVSRCVDIYREHKPALQLPEDSKHALETLSSKFKLGLLTDGYAVTQRNKVKALKIESFFDLIVYSADYDTAKPDETLYQFFMEKFPDESSYCYVADNPKKDFITPNKLGWYTVRLNRQNGIYSHYLSNAQVEFKSMTNILNQLLEIYAT